MTRLLALVCLLVLVTESSLGGGEIGTNKVKVRKWIKVVEGKERDRGRFTTTTTSVSSQGGDQPYQQEESLADIPSDQLFRLKELTSDLKDDQLTRHGRPADLLVEQLTVHGSPAEITGDPLIRHDRPADLSEVQLTRHGRPADITGDQLTRNGEPADLARDQLTRHLTPDELADNELALQGEPVDLELTRGREGRTLSLLSDVYVGLQCLTFICQAEVGKARFCCARSQNIHCCTALRAFYSEQPAFYPAGPSLPPPPPPPSFWRPSQPLGPDYAPLPVPVPVPVPVPIRPSYDGGIPYGGEAAPVNPWLPSDSGYQTKPGRCPDESLPNGLTPTSLVPRVPGREEYDGVTRCRVDYDCLGLKKCCPLRLYPGEYTLTCRVPYSAYLGDARPVPVPWERAGSAHNRRRLHIL